MPTVRLNAESHLRLKLLADHERRSQQDVLQAALQLYEDSVFFRQLDADFSFLAGDPPAMEDYRSEARLWEGTLGDGLANS